MLFLKLLLNNLLYTILMATAISVDENAENKWRDILNYQLANNIRPFHYNLKIILMPDYISGESNTIFYIKYAKPYIILHMPMLMNISEVKLKSIENKMIYAMNYSIFITNENLREKLLIIEPFNQLMSQKYLKRGVHILYFKFTCIMNHDTRDFLRTSYTKEKKGDGFIFATLIQPRRAQQLCPCWDVPKLSATFNISVEHHKKYKVLSNMPVQEYKSVDNSTMCTVFQMTPPMSTYDVAIIMSDQYQVSNSTVLVNTWCRSQVIPHMIFMQSISENVITYLENSFRILRRIPKMDYVVIPNLEDRIRQTWGLVLYKFTYLNSTSLDDLWGFMQKSVYRKLKNKLYNLSIKQIMDIWTIQTHCPVVNVIRNYSKNLVTISKETHDELDQQPYFIPVSCTKETNINFVISLESFNCLTQSKPKVEIYYDNKDKWFIANILQTGYYRVNYDNDNWMMIAYYLNSEKYENIHVINRAQIIGDAFHLMMEEKLDSAIFWELASYLWRERNYIAWYPMIKAFEHISSLFAFPTTDDEHLEVMKDIVGSLFENINEHVYNQIRSNNDFDKYLKQELTKWGCLINNSLCLKMTKEQFEWHLKKPKINKFLPGWNKLIFCYGSKTVNHTIWIKAFNEYKISDYEILKFLSCSDNLQNIVYYLWFILSKLKYEMRTLKDKNIDFGALTHTKKHVYISLTDIFFSLLAIHAKNSILLRDILVSYNFKFIQDSGINTIVTLIVIINNIYSKNNLDQISKFAKDNMPQLVSECIERKITTRLLEIENQRKFYKIMFPPLP
ncbi:aminopeptidase N-like [Cataglyphis hispanica]|uniref:aminopeptidase N-like n=1 Tax=Cataglyphis hispanica TaxID=1086592 RepID=UPI00217F305E|nr:aminopeptidase N-like [Cataglyphis hispanica]